MTIIKDTRACLCDATMFYDDDDSDQLSDASYQSLMSVDINELFESNGNRIHARMSFDDNEDAITYLTGTPGNSEHNFPVDDNGEGRSLFAVSAYMDYFYSPNQNVVVSAPFMEYKTQNDDLTLHRVHFSRQIENIDTESRSHRTPKSKCKKLHRMMHDSICILCQRV